MLLQRNQEQEATVQRLLVENSSLQESNCILKERLKASELKMAQIEQENKLLRESVSKLENEVEIKND